MLLYELTKIESHLQGLEKFLDYAHTVLAYNTEMNPVRSILLSAKPFCSLGELRVNIFKSSRRLITLETLLCSLAKVISSERVVQQALPSVCLQKFTHHYGSLNDTHKNHQHQSFKGHLQHWSTTAQILGRSFHVSPLHFICQPPKISGPHTHTEQRIYSHGDRLQDFGRRRL